MVKYPARSRKSSEAIGCSYRCSSGHRANSGRSGTLHTAVWAKTVRVYAETRKLRGAEIPYEELEERRREFGAEGQAARLRCRRPWMLSTHRKK